MALTEDEKLRIEYHDINGRESPHKSSLALSRKALHSGAITRGRMNFYLYGNLDLVVGQMVTLPRMLLKIPSQRAIMLITRELGTQTRLSTNDNNISGQKNPSEEDEPMEEEPAQAETAPEPEQEGSQEVKPPSSPKASTSGMQQHVSTAPVNLLLTQEARDIQFEISQEILDELTQERENEIFSLVTWESAEFTNEEGDLSPPLPDLITK